MVPRRLAFRIVTGLHRGVFELSHGRIGGRLGAMTVVELTTTGRKSGKKRTTMLTAPLGIDGDIVLVASYGGGDQHPNWYLNLCADPEVEVTTPSWTRAFRAREASPEEKATLWPRIVHSYAGYDRYRRATRRDIPLVVLEPH